MPVVLGTVIWRNACRWRVRTIYFVPFLGLGLKLLTSLLHVFVSSLSHWIESRYGDDLASTTYIMMNGSWMMVMWEKKSAPLLLNPVYCRVSLLKWFSPHSNEYSIQRSKIPQKGLQSPMRSSPTTALCDWAGVGEALEGSLWDAEHAQLQQRGKSSSEFYMARTPTDLQEKYSLKTRN